MKKEIRMAVFPVAGLGTRFLPATKALPKELLPILDKPLVQYAAEEAIAAGIDTLIFVTGRNKRAIEDHFDRNKELENILNSRGDIEQANMIKNILPSGVQCVFVRQMEQLGLGHAVLCAERVVGGEPFAVILADDFLVSNGLGVTSDLIEKYKKTGKSQLSVMPVDYGSVSKYGVIEIGKKSRSVKSIVEKPSALNAPSNLVSIGRYVLTADIFNIIRGLDPGVKDEIQLTDALSVQASQGNLESVELEGKRFDCGSMRGFIEAIIYKAKREYPAFMDLD